MELVQEWLSDQVAKVTVEATRMVIIVAQAKAPLMEVKGRPAEAQHQAILIHRDEEVNVRLAKPRKLMKTALSLLLQSLLKMVFA